MILTLCLQFNLNITTLQQACYGPTAPSFALPTSGPGAVKILSNEAVIRGASLRSIVDSEHLVAIIQDKLE